MPIVQFQFLAHVSVLIYDGLRYSAETCIPKQNPRNTHDLTKFRVALIEMSKTNIFELDKRNKLTYHNVIYEH
jgi:hypothetical protein